MDVEVCENSNAGKSRRKQVFEKVEDIDDEDDLVQIKAGHNFPAGNSHFFDEFDAYALGDLWEETDEPADEATEAEIRSTLDLIRSKHPSEFDIKNKKKGRKTPIVRGPVGRPKGSYKDGSTRDLAHRTAAYFLKQLSSIRDGDGSSSDSDTNDGGASAVVARTASGRSRRTFIPRIVDLSFAPEITDGIPHNLARPRLFAVQIDRHEAVARACGGFRLFVRKFSDQMLADCLQHPLFDSFEGRAPKQLRYVHILRQVWLQLPEDERHDWQNLYQVFVNESPDATQCEFITNDDRCVESLKAPRKVLSNRVWIQSIEPDKLPCPLCSRDCPKRHSMPELFGHMSLAHPSVRLYACHFCNRAFVTEDLLKSHAGCEQFAEYLSLAEGGLESTFIFNYAYVSVACAECGFHLILSPKCDEEAFTSSYLNCMMTHNSNSFVELITYSCAELTGTHVKLGFHRTFPDADLRCRHCPTTAAEGESRRDSSKSAFKTFENVFELDKHLRISHKKQIAAMKCPRCPASFYHVNIFNDHILSHIQELSMVTAFLETAPIFPAALARDPVIRVPMRIDFGKLVKDEDDGTFDESALEEKYEQLRGEVTNVRRSCRKRKLASFVRPKTQTPTTVSKRQHICQIKPSEHCWSDYCELMRSWSEITDLARLKSHTEISLPVVFDGRTIVENTVNGLLLNDNVFECKKCCSAIIGDASTVEHLKNCCADLTNYDGNIQGLTNHVHSLFVADGNFPFLRINCAHCRPTTSHCSILALTKHYATAHSKFLKFQKNNSTIQEGAELVLEKDWVRTEFDDYLANELKIAHQAASKCKSEFDEGVADQDYDNYMGYMQGTFSPPSAIFTGDGTNHHGALERQASAGSASMGAEKKTAANRSATFTSPLLDDHNETLDIKCGSFITDASNFSMDKHMAEKGAATARAIRSTTPKVASSSTAKGLDVQPTRSYVSRHGSSESEKATTVVEDLFEPVASGSADEDTEMVVDEDVSKRCRLPSDEQLDTSSRLWSVNPYRRRQPIVQQRRYICFLCGQSYSDITTLSAHFDAHPEQWERCPLCVHDGKWTRRRFAPFENLSDFFRHMVSEHVEIENLLVGCTFCDKTVSSAVHLTAVSSIIRHIVYDCTSTGVCCLCAFVTPHCVREDAEERAADELKQHRLRKHALIYDRIICSACLTGFYAHDQFVRHICEPSIRCCCNPYHVFHASEEFYAHISSVANSNEKVHKEMPTRCETSAKRRQIVGNDDYERLRFVCKAHKSATTVNATITGGRQFVLPKAPSSENAEKFGRFVASTTGAKVVKAVGEETMRDIFDVVDAVVDFVSAMPIERNDDVFSADSAPPTLSSALAQTAAALSEGRSAATFSVASALLARTIQAPTAHDLLKCEYCPFKTHKFLELNAHRKAAHNDNKEYGIPYDFTVLLCRSCCFAFNSGIEYQRHMDSHAPAVACKKCSCVAGRDVEFKPHQFNHSSRNAIYACSCCTIIYTTEAMLMLHMAQMHKMQLAYFCKTCATCNTSLPEIYDHIINKTCRKVMEINYIGFVDATQIQFMPNSMNWLNRTQSGRKPLKFVSLSSCRHSRCLHARSEPLVTCVKCNCLTTVKEFKKNADGEMGEKMNFTLAPNNDALKFRGVLIELAKLSRRKSTTVVDPIANGLLHQKEFFENMGGGGSASVYAQRGKPINIEKLFGNSASSTPTSHSLALTATTMGDSATPAPEGVYCRRVSGEIGSDDCNSLSSPHQLSAATTAKEDRSNKSSPTTTCVIKREISVEELMDDECMIDANNKWNLSSAAQQAVEESCKNNLEAHHCELVTMDDDVDERMAVYDDDDDEGFVLRIDENIVGDSFCAVTKPTCVSAPTKVVKNEPMDVLEEAEVLEPIDAERRQANGSSKTVGDEDNDSDDELTILAEVRRKVPGNLSAAAQQQRAMHKILSAVVPSCTGLTPIRSLNSSIAAIGRRALPNGASVPSPSARGSVASVDSSTGKSYTIRYNIAANTLSSAPGGANTPIELSDGSPPPRRSPNTQARFAHSSSANANERVITNVSPFVARQQLQQQRSVPSVAAENQSQRQPLQLNHVRSAQLRPVPKAQQKPAQLQKDDHSAPNDRDMPPLLERGSIKVNVKPVKLQKPKAIVNLSQVKAENTMLHQQQQLLIQQRQQQIRKRASFVHPTHPVPLTRSGQPMPESLYWSRRAAQLSGRPLAEAPGADDELAADGAAPALPSSSSLSPAVRIVAMPKRSPLCSTGDIAAKQYGVASTSSAVAATRTANNGAAAANAKRRTRAVLDDAEVMADRLAFMRSRSESYMCVTCRATHTKQSDAVMHQFHEHDVRGLRYSLACPVCRRIFDDLTLFYAHLVTNKKHTMLTIKSNWCNFSFRSEEEAAAHDFEHSSRHTLNMSSGVNCCGICGTVKNYWLEKLDERTFLDHTVFHGFRATNVCRLCNDIFPTDYNAKFSTDHYLKRHLRKQLRRGDDIDETNPLNYTFYCKKCCTYVNYDEITDHFTEKHMYTMVEFVPELDNELVISASNELRNRFFQF